MIYNLIEIKSKMGVIYVCERCRRCHVRCNPCRNYCFNDCKYSYYNNPPANISDVLDTVCDGNEHIVYDGTIPWPYRLTATNAGDCPIICYIYYTEGFVVKRESKMLNPGQTWNADLVSSVTRVSFVCQSIGCNSCLSNNDLPHCKVPWSLD